MEKATHLDAQKPDQADMKRYQAYIEHANDLILTLSPKGIITSVNRTFCEVSGYTAEELVGQSPLMLVAPESLDSTMQALGTILSGQNIQQFELEVVTKNEQRRFMEVRGRHILEQGQLVEIFQIARDITERKRAEEEIRRRALEQETLREAVLALTTSLDRGEVIDRILAQLQAVVPYDTASVQLLNGNTLEIVGGRGFIELEKYLGINFTIDREDIPNYHVVRTQKPVIVSDVYADYAEFRRDFNVDAHIRSWMGVPMLIGEYLIGMIALDKYEQNFYTQAHARLAEAFAAQAAIAMENSRLFEAERAQRELAEALQNAAAVVNSTLDPEQVFDRILEQVAQIYSAEAYCIININEENRPHIVRHLSGSKLGNSIDAHCIEQVATQYLTLDNLQWTSESIVIPDITKHARYSPTAQPEWLHSYIGVPIQIAGRTVGFLNLGSAHPHQYSAPDGQKLKAFADHAATAINNAGLHRQLREHAAQLEQHVAIRTAELQAQYARLDAILESSTDGIVVTDHDGTITQTNSVAKAWLTQSLQPEENEKLIRSIRNLTQQTGSEQQRATSLTKVLALTDIDLELSAASVKSPGDKQINTVVINIHDISYLKAMERMKTTFLSNVSHELRTPVTAISLYVYLMQEHPERWGQYLSPLAKVVAQQARLVQDIVSLSRLDAGRVDLQFAPIAASDLIQQCLTQHTATLSEQDITLAYHPPSPETILTIDAEYIIQALGYLLENAIAHTPPNGTLTVTAKRCTVAAREWFTIAVKDEGGGIPVEELPSTFDRFFRSERIQTQPTSDSRLGLSVAKAIAELHDGQITVESQLGQTSTFTLWLPTK